MYIMLLYALYCIIHHYVCNILLYLYCYILEYCNTVHAILEVIYSKVLYLLYCKAHHYIFSIEWYSNIPVVLHRTVL